MRWAGLYNYFFMNTKTILITGGAGYIGSHAVVKFEQAGYKTVILDNFANSDRQNLDGIFAILGYLPDFYECDISDRAWLQAIFEKYDFDGVLHFAGLKSPTESCREVGLYHEKNIFGSIVLFDVMENFGVKNIIFSSSASVYSNENISPITEKMPVNPIHAYGTSKLVIEHLLSDYANHKNWQVIILRYFNPIGAHISGYIGERPQWIPNNLLPYIFDVAIWRRDVLCIFGDDYQTKDGTGVRDYIDVNDLVDAHFVAYKNVSSGVQVYNIGTGCGVSVREMVSLVEEISGKKVPYAIFPRRPGDWGEVFASVEKIEKELGWKAQRTIRDAIESGWNFVKNFK